MNRQFLTTSLLAVAIAIGGCSKTAETGNSAVADNATLNDAATIETTGSPSSIGAYGAAAVATPKFVEEAAISDMYEIASSELALQRSTSPEIKKYAADMIAAHKETTAKLKAALPTSGADLTPPTAMDARRMGLLDTLKSSAPDKFDEVYLDQQTTAHREALGLMDSYGQHGENAALKTLAAATKPLIQGHLDMVSKLDHSGVDDKPAAG